MPLRLKMPSLVLTAVTWSIIPLLLFTDRLHFNGQTVSRTGLTAVVSRLLRARRQLSTVEDIERVDIATLRTADVERPADLLTDLAAGAQAARALGLNRLADRLENADSVADL